MIQLDSMRNVLQYCEERYESTTGRDPEEQPDVTRRAYSRLITMWTHKPFFMTDNRPMDMRDKPSHIPMDQIEALGDLVYEVAALCPDFCLKSPVYVTSVITQAIRTSGGNMNAEAHVEAVDRVLAYDPNNR